MGFLTGYYENPVGTLQGMGNSSSAGKNAIAIPQMVKHGTSMKTSNFTSRYMSEQIESSD